MIAAMAGRFVEVVRSMATGREVTDELEPMLVELVQRAAAAWPDVALDEDQFVRAIAQRLPGDVPPARALAAMQTDDLYLACGCAAGDRGALAAFEQCCGAAIARAIAASGAVPAERADIGQIVRQRLLVSSADGEAPRIARYSGRGSLASWVRVVAAREAARFLPRARREIADDEEGFASLIGADDDPEIGYLKRLYRHEFKRAFQAAIEQLEDISRLVLRQHVLDGLGIDELAGLHRVHRATAARWIQAAREAVLAGTQRELIRRLRLSRSELVSIMRLIESQLDVSLPRLLRRD